MFNLLQEGINFCNWAMECWLSKTWQCKSVAQSKYSGRWLMNTQDDRPTIACQRLKQGYYWKRSRRVQSWCRFICEEDRWVGYQFRCQGQPFLFSSWYVISRNSDKGVLSVQQLDFSENTVNFGLYLLLSWTVDRPESCMKPGVFPDSQETQWSNDWRSDLRLICFRAT